MTTDARKLKIASSGLSATIDPLGAELQDLCDAEGRSLQWDGDPAVWTGRAPLLFPIVGMLAGGHYRLDGRTTAMAKHGFARRSTFAVVSHAPHAAVLRLSATDETRAAYPFDFTLDVAFTLVDAALRIVATIVNHGDTTMPASFGFHPAFRWPLPYGEPREDHVLRFAHDEPAPIRRIDGDGLLRPDRLPTPVVGDTLALRDDLFVDDALILDGLESRRLTYGASRGPRLSLAFDGPMLGVWTRPGAGFVCIEPWHGVADPVGYTGDLRDKPGTMLVEPGDSRVLSLSVALERDERDKRDKRDECDER